MTSSFFVISLVTSWGFNSGGLDKNVEVNYQVINKIEKDNSQHTDKSVGLLLGFKALTMLVKEKKAYSNSNRDAHAHE